MKTFNQVCLALGLLSLSFTSSADTAKPVDFKASAIAAYNTAKADANSAVGKKYAVQLAKYKDQCGGRFNMGSVDAIMVNQYQETDLSSPDRDGKGNYAWDHQQTQSFIVLENIFCGFHHGGETITAVAIRIDVLSDTTDTYQNNVLANTSVPVVTTPNLTLMDETLFK
jgi:hypothetical protein